jgi:hypothetical protein
VFDRGGVRGGRQRGAGGVEHFDFQAQSPGHALLGENARRPAAGVLDGERESGARLVRGPLHEAHDAVPQLRLRLQREHERLDLE